jgi:ABC-type nitrate/sulfonate/bicarbonate transport system substrate-binding protein
MRFAAILAAVLLLAACSAERERLRIGIIRPSIDHLPLSWLFHRDQTLARDYEVIGFSSGWELQEALIGNGVDAAILPFTYVYNAVDKGAPIRIVSFFERETDGLVCRSGIDDPSQLDGKRIGVLKASSLDLLLRDYARRSGFSCQPVHFRSPNELVAALQAGEVEAVVLYVPLIQKLDGRFHVLHWFSESYPAHPCCDLAVNRDRMDAARLVKLKALIPRLRGQLEEANAPGEGYLAFAKRLYGLDRSQLDDALSHTVFRMGLDREGIEFQRAMARLGVEAGYQKAVAPPEKIYWRIDGP